MSNMNNFHLPLPEKLYGQLRDHAKKSGRPATELARKAIAEWLEREMQNAVREEIAEYAAACAGGSQDLDEDLEAAGIEEIVRDQGRAR